jgi:hypothetical protein
MRDLCYELGYERFLPRPLQFIICQSLTPDSFVKYMEMNKDISVLNKSGKVDGHISLT